MTPETYSQIEGGRRVEGGGPCLQQFSDFLIGTLVPRQLKVQRVFSLIFYFVFLNCDHSRKLFLSTGHDVNKWAFVLIFIPSLPLNPLTYLYSQIYTNIYRYIYILFVVAISVFISFGAQKFSLALKTIFMRHNNNNSLGFLSPDIAIYMPIYIFAVIPSQCFSFINFFFFMDHRDAIY